MNIFLCSTLVAFSELSTSVSYPGLHHNSLINAHVSVLHLADNFPESDVSGDVVDPLPQIVRKSMEEVAGDSPVHHQARSQHLGMMVYTGQFTDIATGIEQLITVAPDGNILFIEPVLLTGPRSNQAHARLLKSKAELAPEKFDIQPTDRLQVLDAPQDDQGRDAAPASRMGRLEDHH